MANHPTGHVRVRVVATVETGTVDPDQPFNDGFSTLHLDDGGTRPLGSDEQIRLLPPDWDLLSYDEVA